MRINSSNLRLRLLSYRSIGNLRNSVGLAEMISEARPRATEVARTVPVNSEGLPSSPGEDEVRGGPRLLPGGVLLESCSLVYGILASGIGQLARAPVYFRR